MANQTASSIGPIGPIGNEPIGKKEPIGKEEAWLVFTLIACQTPLLSEEGTRGSEYLGSVTQTALDGADGEETNPNKAIRVKAIEINEIRHKSSKQSHGDYQPWYQQLTAIFGPIFEKYEWINPRVLSPLANIIHCINHLHRRAVPVSGMPRMFAGQENRGESAWRVAEKLVVWKASEQSHDVS